MKTLDSIKNLSLAAVAVCGLVLAPASVSAQCTTWVAPNAMGGWTDFGDAPCDDGTGCPVNEITAFEIFADEAYAFTNTAMGGTYTFSACNGAAGTWALTLTVIAPSGAVDAFGLDGGSTCALAWN